VKNNFLLTDANGCTIALH